jgi:pimeloyl-ACP methyl ester carboxylesterase
MGGYIALAFAERYPDTLSAFGLFHSSAFADSEEKREARRKGIEKMHEESGYAFLQTTVPTLFAPATKERRPEIIEEQLAAVRNVSTPSLVAYYEAMTRRPDRTDVLRNSEVPVLFVMGKFDTAVPAEDSLKQCHLPQTAYIHLLQNSGHMGMMEEVAETNKILEQLITTVENLA